MGIVGLSSQEEEAYTTQAQERATRREKYHMYREYYDGDHEVVLTSRQKKFLELKTGQEGMFRYNYCPAVVHAASRKLIVTGFDTGESDLALALWQWWKQGKMDAIQNAIHKNAARDQDAYLVLGFDEKENRPTFSVELAHDGTEGVEIVYDPDKPATILFAVKEWISPVYDEEGNEAGYSTKLNQYFPNRIQKWIMEAEEEGQEGGGWQHRFDPGDPEEQWPQWWTDTGREGGQPLGVPVVHFKYGAGDKRYGLGRLKDATGPQNLINKAAVDVIAAADTTAFRMGIITGLSPSRGSPDADPRLELTPGTIYAIGDKEAKASIFPGEDLKGPIAVLDKAIEKLAQVTNTPMHFFQASRLRPAEGTLQQEEAALTEEVKQEQVGLGDSWEQAMLMAAILFNAFGKGETISLEGVNIETVWADPTPRNEAKMAEVLTAKKDHRVPEEQIWREWGYTEKQIAEWQASPETQARLKLLEMGL